MWRAWFLVVAACSSHGTGSGSGSGSGMGMGSGSVSGSGTGSVSGSGSGSGSGANDHCTADSDCTIALSPTTACCPRSGAPIAMSLDHEHALSAPQEQTCTQGMVVACPPPVAKDLWPDPVCKDHTCIAQPHVTAVFDPSPFDRACMQDRDCALVENDPCSPCRCTSYGINAAQRGRYLEAFDAFKRDKSGHGCSAAITITPCVHCDAVAPVCNHGQCEAKSSEPVPRGGECASDADCVISCASQDRCCEATPCEDVIAKSKLAAILAAQPDCRAVRCRAPDRPTYVHPRCKVGKCFGEIESRLPGH